MKPGDLIYLIKKVGGRGPVSLGEAVHPAFGIDFQYKKRFK